MGGNLLHFEENNGSCLIIAPHCDDELLACGGIIQEALAKNLKVKVVFLTNGDGFRWAAIRNFKRPYVTAHRYKVLGQIRQKEALTATGCLGLTKKDIYFLGYPDGGLKNLWSENWSGEKPFTSRYTKVNINPYLFTYKINQKYTGEDLISNLEELIAKINPGKIFIPSFYDHHPDHWAAYNFLEYTLFKLKMENRIIKNPEIYQYLIHWNRWPLSGVKKSHILRPPPFLKKENQHWRYFFLTDKQKEMKFAALNKYKTQMQVLKRYLKSFIRVNEIFI